MKLLNKLTILACLFIGALASCESPDLAEGRTDQVNGLLNVTIKIPGNPAEYSATKKGPYEENEEITVKPGESDPVKPGDCSGEPVNPPTGAAVAVIPAVLAAAAVATTGIVLKKRSK